MKEYKYIGLLLSLIVASLFSFFSCSEDDEYNDPIQIETANLRNVTYDRAICGGEIISGKAKERGVCWSTSPLPTIEDSRTSEGSGSGMFTSELIDLEEGTVYYVRAWAKNGLGEVIYGEQKQCVTMAHGRPVVSINGVKKVKEASATIISQMLVDGGIVVSEFGIVYGLSDDLSLDKGTVVKNSISKNEVEVTLNDLIDNTKYYVVAYATYKSETVYSNASSFSTLRYADPTISLEVKNVSGDSFNAKVTAVSGTPLPVLEYGVVYGKTTKPTIEANTAKKAGEGEGTATIEISDLDEDTQYYVRSYTKNKNGTSYSTEIKVLTLSNKALVATVTTTQITAHRAYIGGEILSLGLKNAPLKEAGICWSTLKSPTTTSDHVKAATTDIGEFDALQLFCLKPSTRYYVRAYVTNQYGTNYGEEITFTTREAVSTYFKATYAGNDFNCLLMEADSPGDFSPDQTEAYTALAAAIKKTSSSRSVTGLRYYITPNAAGEPRYLSPTLNYASGTSNFVAIWKTKMDVDAADIYTCAYLIVDKDTNGNSNTLETAAIKNGVNDDLQRSIGFIAYAPFVIDWDTEISTTKTDESMRIIPVQSPDKYKRMKIVKYSIGTRTYTDWW